MNTALETRTDAPVAPMPHAASAPDVTAFFDEATFTVSYVVKDPGSNACAIVDSVLDFDPASGRTSTTSADAIVDHVRRHGLTVEWLLETHVHADHLSAAPYLKERVGGTLAIGFNITVVQTVFGKIFNAGTEFERDGSQFDHLFQDGERFAIGGLQGRVMHTPGHTPACMTFVIGDAAFVGDTLFMPDFGTARADFPGGDARTLYRSIQTVLALPAETRLFLCHDYKAPGRDEYRWETTVAEERAKNVHVHEGVSEDDFVAMRTARDATLSMPRLILPSVQVNMRAGEMPPPEDNGQRYLKLPVNLL
jgi:glyoxylase-like metal-dependent hydrolase (beta-lactamase superfamily II)